MSNNGQPSYIKSIRTEYEPDYDREYPDDPEAPDYPVTAKVPGPRTVSPQSADVEVLHQLGKTIRRYEREVNTLARIQAQYNLDHDGLVRAINAMAAATADMVRVIPNGVMFSREFKRSS